MGSVTFEYKRPPGLTNKEWQDLCQNASLVLRSVTPVDTGRLKAGWRDNAFQGGNRKVTLRSLLIENAVPYAEYVNNGNTRGMAPRDMTGKAQAILDSIAAQYLAARAGKKISERTYHEQDLLPPRTLGNLMRNNIQPRTKVA